MIDDPLYYTATGEIAAVASAGYPARWFADLGLGPRPLTKGDWLWDNTYDRVAVRIGDSVGTFTRGMLAELTVTLADWYAVASACAGGVAGERVVSGELRGMTFRIEPPGGGTAARVVAHRLADGPAPQPAGTPAQAARAAGCGDLRHPDSAPPPLSPMRFTARGEFPNRDALVRQARSVSETLVTELIMAVR